VSAVLKGDSGGATWSCARGVTGGVLVVSGHTDGRVSLWDPRASSNEPVASFVAHTEGVACLDASATHIITGSADSVRLWDFNTRACISDFVGHRKKFDEGVTCVSAFNATTFASGGGDGVAKVFSCT
jgi:WD40 repeat protein